MSFRRFVGKKVRFYWNHGPQYRGTFVSWDGEDLSLKLAETFTISRGTRIVGEFEDQEGDTLHEGEYEIPDGTVVTRSWEVTADPDDLDEDLVLAELSRPEVKVGDKLLLSFDAGWFGVIHHVATIVALSNGKAQFKRDGSEALYEMALTDTVEVIVTEQPSEASEASEVKIVSKGGDIRADGELVSWGTDGIMFAGQDQAVFVRDTDLVVQQMPDPESWQEGDTVLVVDQWGCGGQYMYCGELGRRVSVDTVCFKVRGTDDFEPKTLQPGSVYKVLTPQQFT